MKAQTFYPLVNSQEYFNDFSNVSGKSYVIVSETVSTDAFSLSSSLCKL